MRIKKYLRVKYIEKISFEYYEDINGDYEAFKFAQKSHYKSFDKNEVFFKKEKFFNKHICFLNLLIKRS